MKIDKFGNRYVTNDNGSLFKLDRQGKAVGQFSPAYGIPITDFQVSQSVNIFIFYLDWQQFVLLDRFLGNPREFSLEVADLGYISAACQAADGTLWLFDQSAFSLKKYDPTNQEVLLSLPLNFEGKLEDVQVNQLREYQNKVFALTPDELWVFNSLGELEYRKKWKNHTQFGVYNQTVWGLSEDQLTCWETTTDSTFTRSLPQKDIQTAGFYEDKWHFADEHTLWAYKYLDK